MFHNKTTICNSSAVLMAVIVFAVIGGSIAKADFTFGKPTSENMIGDCLSFDGLETYVDLNQAGGQGDVDIWVCKRATTDSDWGPPENLGSGANSASVEAACCISAGGLELYFNSNRPGGGAGTSM